MRNRKNPLNPPNIENPTHKVCYKCHELKEISSFNKCKTGIYGYHNHCRECSKACKKEWDNKNKEWTREYAKIPENKERSRKQYKERYYSDSLFREKQLEYNRVRRRLEPAKIKQRENEKFRRDTNINYKLGKSLRSRIGAEIRKLKKQLNIDVNKCAKSIDLLGCSISELKVYLESKFQSGMNWENHGYGDNCWHIDHILPCASFDLTKEADQRKCFHYSNLQPLWQSDNLSKSDKIITNGMFTNLT